MTMLVREERERGETRRGKKEEEKEGGLNE